MIKMCGDVYVIYYEPECDSNRERKTEMKKDKKKKK